MTFHGQEWTEKGSRNVHTLQHLLYATHDTCCEPCLAAVSTRRNLNPDPFNPHCSDVITDRWFLSFKWALLCLLAFVGGKGWQLSWWSKNMTTAVFTARSWVQTEREIIFLRSRSTWSREAPNNQLIAWNYTWIYTNYYFSHFLQILDQ